MDKMKGTRAVARVLVVLCDVGLMMTASFPETSARMGVLDYAVSVLAMLTLSRKQIPHRLDLSLESRQLLRSVKDAACVVKSAEVSVGEKEVKEENAEKGREGSAVRLTLLSLQPVRLRSLVSVHPARLQSCPVVRWAQVEARWAQVGSTS